MRTILLPVDFSDHSVATYKYAIKIAGTTVPTKLYLHHSYNDQITVPDPGFSSGFDSESFLNVQLIEEFRKRAEVNMEKLHIEVINYLESNKIKKITVDTSVTGGDPDWEIISYCKEINPDMIVMGTQGSGKKEIFEGSVAKRIMNKANIPVIAVPIGNHIDHNELRIMYACNNKNRDFKKIKLLTKLFENIPYSITVTHFHFEGNKDYNLNLINELEYSIKNDGVNDRISFKFVDSTDKENALDQFIHENDINSIAFISHRTNIFKYIFSDKITKNDFFRLGLPMIALHE